MNCTARRRQSVPDLASRMLICASTAAGEPPCRRHQVQHAHLRLLRHADRLGARHPGRTAPWVDRHGKRDLDDNALLEAFGTIEAACEAETPGKPYPEILAEVLRRLADKWSIKASAGEATEFGQSVGRWPAFADSATSLQYLKRYYKLVILSNVDRASFARSNEKLGVVVRPHPHRPGHRLLQAQPAQFRVRVGRPGAHLRHQEGRHPAHRARASSTMWCRPAPWASPRCGLTGASRSAAGAPRRRPRPRAR